MDLIEQLHATASSPPGKDTPVTIGYEAEWVSNLVWTLLEIRSTSLNPDTSFGAPWPVSCMSGFTRHISSWIEVRIGLLGGLDILLRRIIFPA
jgi:hypothetical protein